MKVLIADDNEDQLQLRGLLLRQNGLETIAAADAKSALQLAADHQPKCAVIDLRLPTEELGLRLIRQLKALDKSIHLFVLTGADPSRLAHYPERDLVDEVVAKGSSSAYLIKKLKALAA